MDLSPIGGRPAVARALIATITIIAGAGVVTVLVGFGSTAKANPRPPAAAVQLAGDACGLVTPQEVSAVFGANSGQAHFVLGTCVYDNGGHELIVAMTRQDARAQFDAGQAGKSVPVDGIGDRAFYRNGELGVLKGTSAMLITLVPSPSAASPAVITLAKAAATRL